MSRRYTATRFSFSESCRRISRQFLLWPAMVSPFRSSADACRTARQRRGYCACSNPPSRSSCPRRPESPRAVAGRTRTTPGGAPDRTQLLHVVMTRAANRVHALATKGRPVVSEMIDRGTDPMGVLGVQALEPSLCLGCEHDLPRAPIRHPCRVMSLPVTEQDAFVPSLTNRCEAALTHASPPRRRHVKRSKPSRPPAPWPHKHRVDAYVAKVLERRGVCCVLHGGPRASPPTFVRPGHGPGQRAGESAARAPAPRS